MGALLVLVGFPPNSNERCHLDLGLLGLTGSQELGVTYISLVSASSQLLIFLSYLLRTLGQWEEPKLKWAQAEKKGVFSQLR